MYGKAYHAQPILRKKKKRPFAKEIIGEVNDGEDLFTALFSNNIKDVKQKIKQDCTRSNRLRKNKIRHEPTFSSIPELPEGETVGSRDFLDPFDALFKDKRDPTEKNKVDDSDSQSKPVVEIHDDEKENLPYEENAMVLDNKDKSIVFESVFHSNKKNVAEKSDSTFKRQPLKLKSDRKGSRSSSKVKRKLNPDWSNSWINIIDCSYDVDTLEDEFKTKREELRKKKEEHNTLCQSKSAVQSASGSQVFSEDACSGNDAYSICSNSSPPNLCYEGKRDIVDFVSSTPAKHDNVKGQSSVNQVNYEGCNGHEGGQRFSTPATHTPDELPSFLSPILCVTEKHVNFEDSDTDNSISDAVKSFTDKKENVCVLPSLNLSPDPFADSDVLHDTEEDLVKTEIQIKEVHDQFSSNHVTKYPRCEQNNVSRESGPRDRVESQSDSIIDENFQSVLITDEIDHSKNMCKYISCIEEDSVSCNDSQNPLKENCIHVQDATHSLSFRNVCLQRSYSSFSDHALNTLSVINNSNQLLKSEIADTEMSSNCSAMHLKLHSSERIPESSKISLQEESVSEKMSKLSLFESRNSCKTMKKKSFAQRRSHLVVPLTQNVCHSFYRISNFREVYMEMPSPRICKDKILSRLQPIERSGSILKYDDDDDDDDVYNTELDEEKEDGVTFKDVVLEHCGQTDVLVFDEAFSDSDLADCKKIGEGAYGEVFARMNSQHQPTVMKIMPIEGDCQINGESQKSFQEILPEIVISMQLSKLQENENFSTSNFPELIDCWCVQGRYPPRLLKLWQEYDEEKTSENDSPEILPEDQLYIVLELSNVGSALESFIFNSAEQSWSAFMQVTYTLAVAEAFLEFEHRDLHWGNILIKRTKDKTITCKMFGEDRVVPTQGIQASVIDFTLSRITYDGCCIYNNLAEDPALFEGTGDYQFDIYRMMRDKTENNWQVFQPYNNVLWLSYVLEKLITESYYRNENTKIHKRGKTKLIEMRNRILDYQSAIEVALSFS